MANAKMTKAMLKKKKKWQEKQGARRCDASARLS
jgi:hypothetical protein